TLTVATGGTGSGTVTSSPAGINCGSTCSGTYAASTVVTLTATAASGSTFSGWSGACSGTGACQGTMSPAQAVAASFPLTPVTHRLTVSKAGVGGGTIPSSPGGINCGPTCSATFAEGSVITLSATPATASMFSGWSGACSGTGACRVTLSADLSVVATFTPAPVTSFTLSVARAGTGSGSVTSKPTGINCGATCSASDPARAAGTLNAT